MYVCALFLENAAGVPMLVISWIPSILFLAEFLAYALAIFITLKQYQYTSYRPYLFITLGLCSILLAALLRLFSSFLHSGKHTLIIFRITNLFVFLAITLWILGFSLFRNETIPHYLIFVVFFTGFSSGFFASSPSISISYDQPTQNWNAVYPTWFGVFVIPLSMIGFYELMMPIWQKSHHVRLPQEKMILRVMFLGMSLTIIWGLSSIFTNIPSIRVYRPFLLPLSWAIWAVAAAQSPLLLGISRSRPTHIIVATTAGKTLFAYHMEKAKPLLYVDDLISSLLQAISIAAEEVFGPGGGLREYHMQDRIVLQRVVPNTELVVFIVTNIVDPALLSAFNLFVAKISNREWHNYNEMIDLTEEVNDTFHSVTFLNMH